MQVNNQTIAEQWQLGKTIITRYDSDPVRYTKVNSEGEEHEMTEEQFNKWSATSAAVRIPQPATAPSSAPEQEQPQDEQPGEEKDLTENVFNVGINSQNTVQITQHTTASESQNSPSTGDAERKEEQDEPEQDQKKEPEQQEDEMFDVEIDGFNPADFEQEKPIESSEYIELRDGEMAYDLWRWERDPKTREMRISGLYHTGILSFLDNQSFAKRYRPDGKNTTLVRGDTIIEPVIATRMRDEVKAYIERNQESLKVGPLSATYEGRLELYNRQHHLIINSTGLEGLSTHDRPLLRDAPGICYIPYANGIVKITNTSIHLQPYSILEGACVWKSQVVKRDFNIGADGEQCQYARFLGNITRHEPDRLRAFRVAIGYLLHHYNNPAEGQAVILYDEEITDARKPEGGTGKGIFGSALRQIRPLALIDGKKFDPNDKFCFQDVDQDTAVVFIDDPVVNHPKPDRRFSLERFFSTLTEGWSIENKREKAFRIPAKEGPKLLIAANVIMSNEGSSNVRRQFILEFSDHYKKQIKTGTEKPIESEHGGLLFGDSWDADEWQKFDRYMIGCIHQFLNEGLIPYSLRSAGKNRLRQTAGEDFYEWVTTYDKKGLQANIEYHRDTLHADYKACAGVSDTGSNTRGFTNNITAYAKSNGWKFERGTDKRNQTFILIPA